MNYSYNFSWLATIQKAYDIKITNVVKFYVDLQQKIFIEFYGQPNPPHR